MGSSLWTECDSVQLSIVIVNWNTCDLLHRCLRAIGDHTHTLRPTGVEVLVVDNASSDGSAKMVREHFPDVRLLVNRENVGFARANNQAIRVSSGHHILLLNSDTEIHPGALDALVGFMDDHPQAGAAGARLFNADGSLQPSCHPMLTPGREFWHLLFLESLRPLARYPMSRWDTTTPRRVEVIKGACLLLRREALDAIGLLDETYFMYTEEVDLCYRLACAGWELWWVPTSRVVHYGEASSRQAAEAMYVQLYRSKMHFFRKFGGDCRANRFRWLIWLAYLPRMTVFALAALACPTLGRRARTYRRLLAELPSM